ncbi:penicillin-binding transpeptidase domain-containing protein [uncultured Jatrophihabitans sp.]|uniref:penicillin-binding transpeptidase domain-containing protein n=1 Tax=uncultured Jatrophihabitans sp. TaxID=1610747 RepID=UPI0035CA1B4A
MLTLLSLVTALALRTAAIAGPNAAAGSLPLVPVQVGEISRLLALGGFAAAWTVRDAKGQKAVDTRPFIIAASSLFILYLGLLFGVGDRGPMIIAAIAGLAVVILTVDVPRRHMAAGALMVIAAGATAVLAGPEYVRERFDSVFRPDSQLAEALIASHAGGLIGPGPGRSPLAAGIPAITSDYAMAALIADFGVLVIGPAVLALLLMYCRLALTTACHATAAGTISTTLVISLAAQTAWNALATAGVAPLTGVNAPFLGISGTSLASSAGALGVVIGALNQHTRASARTDSPPAGYRALRLLVSAGTVIVCVAIAVAHLLLAVSPQRLTDWAQERMPRGTIWTADGRPIADDANGGREHPYGRLYVDTGWDTWGYTQQGVESVWADTLTCGGHVGAADLLDALFHPLCKPADIVTSLDSSLQNAGARAFADSGDGAPLHGSFTVYDTRTGLLLGLYSTDTDPDQYLRGAVKTRGGSTARLLQTAPGSTAKSIAASAALLDGYNFADAPASTFTGRDGQTIHNFDDETCPSTDVQTALADSCNSVFAAATAAVGAKKYLQVAHDYFGVDQTLRFDSGSALGFTSGVPGGTTLSDGQLARTAIGQESAKSTVLGVSLLTAAVVNGGRRETPWPRLVSAVCRGGGGPQPTRQLPAIGKVLPDFVAAPIREGMRLAVSEGTARSLASLRAVSIAKTGTAERVDGGEDAWISAVVHDRFVVTAVVYDAPAQDSALRVAAKIVPAVPAALPATRCPPAAPR